MNEVKMRYFNINNIITAIGINQEFLIQSDWIEITEIEAIQISNPIKNDIELELERVVNIKQKAGELINSKYPDYKQLNIIRVGGAELAAMTAYIDGIRAKSNEAEALGTLLEDIDWEIVQ